MSSIKKKEKNILFPLFHSPFHEQFSSQMRGGLWNDWGGYKAATVVQDEELVKRLKELEECQRTSWEDVHGWVQNASCLVEHFLGIH